MRQHVGYWSQLAANGAAVAFGPVADPAGGYGVAIVEAGDEAAVRQLTAYDPLSKANAGFTYAVHAMPQLILRPSSS
jgi:uncharacterized protein YciI